MCANVHPGAADLDTFTSRAGNIFQLLAESPLVISTQSDGENRLLATLPRQSRRRLLAGCEQVELRSAEVICESGERLRHGYFPTSGSISLITTLGDGSRLEVGSVGHEGMLGSSLILGIDVSAQRAVVQRSGTAWRLGAAALQLQLRENTELRRLLNCYVYALMGQLAQTTACSHYHQVRARLARWLLMTRDQARGNQFHVTQEFLAHMLGVRRVGITNAANSLREEGLIDYRRGAITILDGRSLEQASCACYRGGTDIYERALAASRAWPRSRRS
ncbi:MAG: Crp/Fnr family transcriptional regulator [Pseudomonadota bacterium]|nr:Crp/Fnr family transcriptional regulator [Pseudomonadota bacterium]